MLSYLLACFVSSAIGFSTTTQQRGVSYIALQRQASDATASVSLTSLYAMRCGKKSLMRSLDRSNMIEGYDGATNIIFGTSKNTVSHRRSVLQHSSSLLLLLFTGLVQQPLLAAASDSKRDTVATTAESRKFIQSYPDFTQVIEDDGSFWSYKDVKVPTGSTTSTVTPQIGDRVVYEWSGYTIGYFGRPFEAKGGPQGGAFDKELDYSRSVLGKGELIKGLENAFLTDNMTVGTIRQVVIPYGPLSYPAGEDADHSKIGPKPSTFSGQRALNFVLDNPRVDRTLLFNIKLVRVDSPDNKGLYKKK